LLIGVANVYSVTGFMFTFAVIPVYMMANLGVFLLYRRRIPESAMWEQAPKSRRPVREVLLGSARRDFWQVFVLMSGMWFLGSGVVSVLPVLLLGELDIAATTVTWIMLLANVAFAAVLVVAGVVGQRIGRRRLMTLAGPFIVLVPAPLYVLLSSGRVESLVWLFVLAASVVAATMAVWGVVTSYVNERFPTAVRSSGFGLGYTLAVIIPSFFSAYMAGLEAVCHRATPRWS